LAGFFASDSLRDEVLHNPDKYLRRKTAIFSEIALENWLFCAAPITKVFH
jgi:hypothetical protein